MHELVSASATALAQSMDSLQALPSDPGTGSGYFSLLLRTLLYLLAITVLVYVALKWVAPRLFRWNFTAGGSMAVIDRLPLGGHKSVCVLRAAGRYYLVPGTDSHVRLLTELDPQEVESRYPDKTRRSAETQSSAGS